MWHAQCEKLPNFHSLRVVITQNSSPISYATVIGAWQKDSNFRNFFIDLLVKSPFASFRWETPPITTKTVDTPFEFVLIDSPSLSCPPDRQTFSPYFQPSQPVVNFLNLGKDAVLVVPCPTDADCDYSHLGTFVQNAPRPQQHALWTLVGDTMAQRISNQPVWLSTAGGGVAWLHVRLDNYPKYYHHHPYRQIRESL